LRVGWPPSSPARIASGRAPRIEREDLLIRPLLDGSAGLDRVSGAVAPTFAAPLVRPARKADADVLGDLYGTATPAELTELLDHEIEGVFPSELPHAYFTWQIDRERRHSIEAVASSAPLGELRGG
jgi:hypothetical protein